MSEIFDREKYLNQEKKEYFFEYDCGDHCDQVLIYRIIFRRPTTRRVFEKLMKKVKNNERQYSLLCDKDFQKENGIRTFERVLMDYRDFIDEDYEYYEDDESEEQVIFMYWKEIVEKYPDMYAFITDEKECNGEIKTCKLLDVCIFEEKSDYVKKYIDSGIKFLCLRTTPKLPGDIKTLSEMKSNERLLMALHKAVELKSDIELGKLIHYAASIDDLAYMSDEDLALQIEGLNKLAIFEIENDCPLLG